jgi:hypothetical protein
VRQTGAAVVTKSAIREANTAFVQSKARNLCLHFKSLGALR